MATNHVLFGFKAKAMRWSSYETLLYQEHESPQVMGLWENLILSFYQGDIVLCQKAFMNPPQNQDAVSNLLQAQAWALLQLNSDTAEQEGKVEQPQTLSRTDFYRKIGAHEGIIEGASYLVSL